MRKPVCCLKLKPLETTFEALITVKKIEGIIFIALGTVAVLLAFFFLRIIQYSFFKGMAIVFLMAGTWQIAEGCNTLITCRQMQLEANIYNSTKGTETDDALKKLSSSPVCKYTSIAGFFAGWILFFSFHKSRQTFWKGCGLGLILQGLILSTLFIVKGSQPENMEITVTQQVMKV